MRLSSASSTEMVPDGPASSAIACSSHTLEGVRTGGDLPRNGSARHTSGPPVTTLVNTDPPVQAGPMTTQTLIRHEGLVTSLSWIPTEAIEGAQRLAFDSGITHYDSPPPTDGMDVERLRDEDRFRFANRLGAFITVDDEQIVDCGYEGGGLMGTPRG